MNGVEKSTGLASSDEDFCATLLGVDEAAPPDVEVLDALAVASDIVVRRRGNTSRAISSIPRNGGTGALTCFCIVTERLEISSKQRSKRGRCDSNNTRQQSRGVKPLNGLSDELAPPPSLAPLSFDDEPPPIFEAVVDDDADEADAAAEVDAAPVDAGVSSELPSLLFTLVSTMDVELDDTDDNQGENDVVDVAMLAGTRDLRAISSNTPVSANRVTTSSSVVILATKDTRRAARERLMADSCGFIKQRCSCTGKARTRAVLRASDRRGM